jgi:hypothetical protein
VILLAEDIPLARVEVAETANLERNKEYVEFRLQTDSGWRLQNSRLVAVDETTAEIFPVQVFDVQQPPGENIVFCSVIFPLRLQPGETKTLLLKALNAEESERLPSSDLKMNGEGLELCIENSYYRADPHRAAKS